MSYGFLRSKWMPDKCPKCGSYGCSEGGQFFSDVSQYISVSFECADCGYAWKDFFNYSHSVSDGPPSPEHSRPMK